MEENKSADLKIEIKELIIETLNLVDVNPEQVNNNAPLFAKDNDMGIDSIDALEIIMALQRKYNIRIDDQNLARSVLDSIDSIAEFVNKETTKN